MGKPLEYYLSLKYKIELEYEAVDDTWIAYHPDLGRGTCYAIGDTQEEALKQLNELRPELITLLYESGDAVPEPKTEELPSGQFVLRIPKTLHKKLKDKASQEGISLNQYVAHILSSESGKDDAIAKLNDYINKMTESLTQKDPLDWRQRKSDAVNFPFEFGRKGWSSAERDLGYLDYWELQAHENSMFLVRDNKMSLKPISKKIAESN